LRRDFGPKEGSDWKKAVKDVAKADKAICRGFREESVPLLRSSSSAEAVSVRQASLAACSASKAPHFRCNVTAVTPPNRWTDDVVTFFLRFAARENEEKLDELRDQMKQFYGDEENEEKWERVEDPGEGDIVAVPGSSDHYWYRAVIVAKEEEEEEETEQEEEDVKESEKEEKNKKEDKKKVDDQKEKKGESGDEEKEAEDEEEDEKENHFWVRLLDYGAFIKVAQSNIMVLRNEKDFEFVTKVPFQAIFASFPRDLVVKAASKGEEEEQKEEEEEDKKKKPGEEKKEEKKTKEEAGDSEGKQEKSDGEKSGDGGRNGGKAGDDEEEGKCDDDDDLEKTFRFLSQLVHSGSSTPVVGKLVDFWSAEAADAADADAPWEEKLRLFDDVGKIPVVDLFDLKGWKDAEFRVSDVLVNQDLAEFKM